MVESREASPTLSTAIQVIHPPEQAPGQPERPLHTQTERSKPRLSNQLLLNSYHPPKGLAPPMEEVLASGIEGTQEIIDLWRPFNRGKSLTDHLHNLYLALIRMPVTVRVKGRSEDYALSAPVSIGKEDLLHMVEDGMLVRNRNFAQSTKMVCL